MTTQRHGDYSASLVLDQEGPLTDDQLAWLDRVRAVRVTSGDLSDRLLGLAGLCELAEAHPEFVQPASVLRRVRDRLRALAGEVDG
jgi:hypothetical protein